MNYQELNLKHSKEMDSFDGIFFAFNMEQFKEGMLKIGLQPDETSKIFKIVAGGYMLKSRDAAFEEMLTRHNQERQELRKDRKLAIEALTYELQNHEYSYTGEIEPALEALGWDIKDVDDAMMIEATTNALQ